LLVAEGASTIFVEEFSYAQQLNIHWDWGKKHVYLVPFCHLREFDH